MWIKLLASGWTWCVVLLLALLASHVRYLGTVSDHQRELVKAGQLAEARLGEVITTERKLVGRIAMQAKALELEKEELENETNRVINNLRNDVVRLRGRFQCPAQAPRLPSEPTPTGQRDGGEERGLLESDGEFLIRLAGEADQRVAQLSACQAVIRELTSDSE